MEQRDQNIQQEEQVDRNGKPDVGAAADVPRSASAAAYERARLELQDALARLRTEVARVDFAQARNQARTWVRDNPELASLIALGGGLLLGRAVSGALKPAPPPPLTKRLRTRADLLSGQAQRLAEDVAAAVASGAIHAGDAVARQARVASEQAREAGETLARRAGAAAESAAHGASEMGDLLADRAHTFGDLAAHRAREAADSIESSAGHLGRKLEKRGSRGVDYAESMLDAARTIVAAAVIKRVNGWLRKMS